jgi:DNA repair protein RadC
VDASKFSIRVIEPQQAQSLKAAVCRYLSAALRHSALSEQVWLVTVAVDGTLRGRVCCYVGERCEPQTYARRMVLAMLQSGATRFITVHSFPLQDNEGEVVAMVVAQGLQNIEGVLDVEILDQLIVTGTAEEAWWRSMVKPD